MKRPSFNNLRHSVASTGLLIGLIAGCSPSNGHNAETKVPDGTFEITSNPPETGTATDTYSDKYHSIVGRVAVAGKWEAFLVYSHQYIYPSSVDVPRRVELDYRSVSIGNMTDDKNVGLLPCSLTAKGRGESRIYPTASSDKGQMAGREHIDSMLDDTQAVVDRVKGLLVTEDVHIDGREFVVHADVDLTAGLDTFDPTWVTSLVGDASIVMAAASSVCASR